MEKEYSIKYLIEALQETGITHAKTLEGAQQTVYAWIRKGKLVPRRRPHNKWYVFTQNEIEDIVDAFSTEGSGHWSYKDSQAS